ncbi:MAG: F0F1 ATP synthase subunit delta [Chloroflexi bacterium]|nr:F0F1 ATP synthase subunit delta [Chloroflexota bacterium]
MPKAPSAKRYARAAFDIARESGQIERWAEDLARALEALQDQELLAYLESPKLAAAERVDLIRRAASALNPMAVNLLALLATKNRLALLPGVYEEYQALADAHYGRIRAQVATAVPLESGQGDRIKRQLEEMLGQEVVISSRVDPEVLGGVVARVGDRLIDGSLRGRLVALRRHLAEARG